MKVTEVIVSAGRTFNHPFEQYSNLKPHVTFKAAVEEGEDFEQVAKTLQAKAESLVEDHKRMMLASIEELHDLTNKQQEVQSLEQSINRAQERLDAIRNGAKAQPAIEQYDDEPLTRRSRSY